MFPINIPALAATVHVDYDLNHELKLHGVSNLASGLVGGLPNYLGYCNSVMYARCGGGGWRPARLFDRGGGFISRLRHARRAVRPAVPGGLPHFTRRPRSGQGGVV